MNRALRILHTIPILALASCAVAAPTLQTPAATAPNATTKTPVPTVQLAPPQGLEYTAAFFPDATYDAALATPDSMLGFPLGERPAHHAQVVACWRKWAEQSKRVKLETYGRTHEGHELLCGVVGSEQNIARLEDVLARVAKLADPRTLSVAEQDALVRDTPAIAWIACSIHGDEMSGVDGGLALAYRLIAGTDDETNALLKNVVVVIDPMQNPDGRERMLALLAMTTGATPTLDGDAMQHGRWPNGRGNHYLFDMNRDWMAGVAPETRGRWKAVQRFHPQLFVDAHEMGRDDSYLFYPQADPINPHLPAKLVDWQRRYAAGISASFDRYGWSYYTREWADGWGPFYSDSWGSLNGATGVLYEQARYDGQTVKLASGEIATYRAAAHHQAVASWANTRVLAEHREEALREFVTHRRAVLERPLERPFVVFRVGANAAREQALLGALVGQGIEVRRASRVELSDATSANGAHSDTLKVDGDVWLIDAHQPQGALVTAFLEFDTRYPKADLERERKELETKGNSKIYDSTAWDFAHAFGLDAWWCKSFTASGAASAVLSTPAARGGSVRAPLDASAHVYGWLVDGADDASVTFAAQALELGLAVAICDEGLESAGRAFARGSVLVRAHENAANAAQQVERAAQFAGVEVTATTSARAPGEGHDLGGQHFQLLARPRVALLSNAPVSSDSFGHLWHQLDRVLGLPVSLLDAQDLGGYDLRRYNVLVLPPAGGMRGVIEPLADELKAWVRSGGTLIAIGGSAASLCDAEFGFSAVLPRAKVLEKLEEYRFEAGRERAGQTPSIDEGAVWDGPQSAADKLAKADNDAKKDDDDKKADSVTDAEREERWMQRFSPAGAFLRGFVRNDQWITCGATDELPVYFEGSLSLWSRSPVTTAVRFAPAEQLRLSGLLWPEARERLADSAYLTVERMGNGQVILFAAQPGFRGYHAATGRLFANAVVYGPGVGANPARQH
jgi:hypothetical protein